MLSPTNGLLDGKKSPEEMNKGIKFQNKSKTPTIEKELDNPTNNDIETEILTDSH